MLFLRKKGQMLFEAVFYLKIIFPHKSRMVPEFVTTEGAR